MKRFMIRRCAGRGSERGQMLPLIALSAAVLIAMVGLGIDLGFAYVTKARLSKACDAAALAGMENINQGTVTAKQVAFAEFYANYANGALKTSLDTATVTPTFTFSPNSSSATQLTVTASTSIQTFFVKVLSSVGDSPWKTEVVGDSSVVSRGKLDFTLVLDKSGSMNTDRGAWEMYSSVTNFLSFFSDTLDKGALVTFSTLAQVNVAMTSPFTTNIASAVKTIYGPGGANGPGICGYTTGPLGLTNAMAIENAQPWPSTSNLVKAVIFFTDGKMNGIENQLNCSPPANMSATNLVFSSGDPNQTFIDFFDPGNQNCNAAPLGTKDVNGNGWCPTSGSFPSLHAQGGVYSFTDGLGYKHVRDESQDRCITYAQEMRDAGIVVYAVGLSDQVDANFLQILANDPASSGYSATPNDGIYVPAVDQTQMAAAFQRVAENLLLRLVH